MRIDIYSHCIKVTQVVTDWDKATMLAFCKPMVEMGLEKRGRKFVQVPLRTYAAANNLRTEFSFHRNQEEDFLRFLRINRTYPESRLKITRHAANMDDRQKVTFNVKNLKTPRDYQEPLIEYVLDDGVKYPNVDPIIKMITLKPGLGKTTIAQHAMYHLSTRTVLHFKGGYVQRWMDDLLETFDFAEGELITVRGIKDMVKLMKMALAGTLKAKVIIISNGTMREYIKDYEKHSGRSKLYPVAPLDFYPTLGIGFRIMDEVHQEFHNNFKIDLYSHVPKSLSLSATMVSSDRFKNKVYDISYPVKQRNDGDYHDIFIRAVAVLYSTRPETRVDCIRNGAYSHTLFEENIMLNRQAYENYRRLILKLIQVKFHSQYEPGKAMLLFCSSVAMCTDLTEYLRKVMPTYNTQRYVGSEDDDYQDFLDCDIAVTTPGSAGTAVDKPNLVLNILTVNLDSRQLVEQIVGRTRRPKSFPEVTPEFLHLVCLDIPKHLDYYQNKKTNLKDYVIEHNEIRSSQVV